MQRVSNSGGELLPEPATDEARGRGCGCSKDRFGYNIPFDCPVHTVWVLIGDEERLAFTHYQGRYPDAGRVEKLNDTLQTEASGYRWYADPSEPDFDHESLTRARNV